MRRNLRNLFKRININNNLIISAASLAIAVYPEFAYADFFSLGGGGDFAQVEVKTTRVINSGASTLQMIGTSIAACFMIWYLTASVFEGRFRKQEVIMSMFAVVGMYAAPALIKAVASMVR